MSTANITKTVNSNIDKAIKNAKGTKDQKDAAHQMLVNKYQEYNELVEKANDMENELDVTVGELYRRNLISIADVAGIVGVTRQTIHKKLTAMFGVDSLKEIKPPKNRKNKKEEEVASKKDPIVKEEISA